uniref:DnaK protein n=1 Tax=Rhabditophanes sp. KR3021 TaxID=114890 RepID=A0AC35TX19_9BILA
MADFAIDFGNCHSTIARLGDCFPEIITNDYDKYQTRSIVGFRQDERICGQLAKDEIFLNFQSTITNFKHLLGRDFTDRHAQDLSKFIPSEIRATDDNKVAFAVEYKGKTKIVRCEEVLAGLIKHLANCFTLKTNINPTRIVITCPSFFTSSQRQAIIDATEIAGFKCHKLVNENSAIARLFSLVTTDMPSTNYQMVLFLNIGQTSAEVSIFKMNSKKCKLEASQYSLLVGGLYFDDIICQYFARKIEERYNIDINSDKKTFFKLLSRCETIKKKISRHNNSEKIIFDNFMNIPVFEDSIDNSIFVKLAETKFKVIEDLIKKTLDDAKLEPKDIEKIVLTGGSVRIPKIKQIIERIFKKNINGTMNEDDAVSMGGSLFTTKWTSDYEFESNEQILNILNDMEEVINYDQNESSRTVDYYNELKIKLYIELDKYFQNPNIKEKYEELFRETINSLSSEADIATKNDSNNSEKEENATIPALNQQTSTYRGRGKPKFGKREIADLEDLKPNSHSVTKGSISCNKSSGNVDSQSDHHREGRKGHEDRKGGGNKRGDQSGSSLDSNKDDIVSNNQRKDLPSE